MQKARILSTLDKSFNTKDYGNLNTKSFIETAVKDGKTLQAVPMLKKKYYSGEYGLNDYISEVAQNFNENSKIRTAFVEVYNNRDGVDEHAD